MTCCPAQQGEASQRVSALMASRPAPQMVPFFACLRTGRPRSRSRAAVLIRLRRASLSPAFPLLIMLWVSGCWGWTET